MSENVESTTEPSPTIASKQVVEQLNKRGAVPIFIGIASIAAAIVADNKQLVAPELIRIGLCASAFAQAGLVISTEWARMRFENLSYRSALKAMFSRPDMREEDPLQAQRDKIMPLYHAYITFAGSTTSLLTTLFITKF